MQSMKAALFSHDMTLSAVDNVRLSIHMWFDKITTFLENVVMKHFLDMFPQEQYSSDRIIACDRRRRDYKPGYTLEDVGTCLSNVTNNHYQKLQYLIILIA